MGLRRKPRRPALWDAHGSFRFPDPDDSRSLMGTIALRAVNLSKQFKIGGGEPRYRTLRDDLAAVFSAPFRGRKRSTSDQANFCALQDVSLEVEQGEIVGIIGRNGAGKS